MSLLKMSKSADNYGSVHIYQRSLHKETSLVDGAFCAVSLLSKPFDSSSNITGS